MRRDMTMTDGEDAHVELRLVLAKVYETTISAPPYNETLREDQATDEQKYQAKKRKIAAAGAARQDPDFMIIARCDARAVEGFAESVERGQRYLAAGADAIFAEAMQSRDEFARYAEEVKGPLLANMTEFGKSPHLTVDEFSELGYNMVIFPMSAFRAMMKAVEGLFRELREKGTLEDMLPRMQTREELYQLLDYDAYTQLDAELAARFPEKDIQ